MSEEIPQYRKDWYKKWIFNRRTIKIIGWFLILLMLYGNFYFIFWIRIKNKIYLKGQNDVIQYIYTNLKNGQSININDITIIKK